MKSKSYLLSKSLCQLSKNMQIWPLVTLILKIYTSCLVHLSIFTNSLTENYSVSQPRYSINSINLRFIILHGKIKGALDVCPIPLLPPRLWHLFKFYDFFSGHSASATSRKHGTRIRQVWQCWQQSQQRIRENDNDLFDIFLHHEFCSLLNSL